MPYFGSVSYFLVHVQFLRVATVFCALTLANLASQTSTMQMAIFWDQNLDFKKWSGYVPLFVPNLSALNLV